MKNLSKRKFSTMVKKYNWKKEIDDIKTINEINFEPDIDNDAVFESESLIRIKRDFFLTDAVDLAKKLIGKIIVRKIDDIIIKCKIVETEAYMGGDDKGSHCYNDKKTERTKYFWNPGGCLYIYMIYGINHCVNIVANDENTPQAVLIRAVEPLLGIDKIKEIRGEKLKNSKNLFNLTNGPGKVAASLKLDRNYNGVDVCFSDEIFLVDNNSDEEISIETSRRVNIDYAEDYIDKQWRFYIKNNGYVSKVKL